MDSITKSEFPICADVPDFGPDRIVVGARQLRKAILGGTARRVFLAANADPAVIEPLRELCIQYNIPYSCVRSMTELGRACRIDVGAAAAAVVD